MLIGLIAKKQSGKGVMANHLVGAYGYIKYSFASPMKEMSKILFNWTEQYVNGDLKEVIDDRWGISPRQFLQFFGSDIMQFSLPNKFPEYKMKRNHWVQLFNMWYQNHQKENIVIDDCRFIHEIDYIKKNNGITIRIIRPNLNNIDQHISEMELEQIQTDYNVINDSTIENFYEKIDNLNLF